MTDSLDSNQPAGWDHLFKQNTFPPRYQALAAPNDSVVEWADTLPPGSLILDLGCGVGRHVLYLGGRGFKLAGLDVSPFGVQATHEMCTERYIDFDGRVGNMTSLPWPDATFDALLSTATVCHHRRAEIVTTMAEVHRVLKPGGLFLVDFLHKDTLSYQRVREQVASGEISEIEPDTFMDESSDPDMGDDAFLPHHYCDEADVRALLQPFEILKLWADLPGRTAEGGLGQRGYWIAQARTSG